jgi:hypothetical protein
MPPRHGSDATVSPAPGRVEARWFLAERIPHHLRPAGEGGMRTDLYHLPTLNPVAAWKRRSRRTPEFKFRDPNPRMVRVEGIGGIAECWHKVRPSVEPSLADEWLAVRKQVWQRPGLQIAEASVEGAAWSTLAVCLDADTSEEIVDTLGRWHDDLDRAGMAVSYPTWLLARRWLRCGADGVLSNASA